MAESVTIELLKQMLGRLPGVTFCSRMHPETWASEWLYVDERAAEIWDVPMEQLLANPMSALDRCVPEDRPLVEGAMAKAIAECGRTEVCSRYLRRDGRLVWLESHCNIQRDTDGTVLWYGHIIDVTARKTLEQSLADSEAARARAESLYRTVIDNLPVGVLVASPKREWLIYNKEATRNTGGPMTAADGDVAKVYGVFKADGVTPLPTDETALIRCLRGVAAEEEIVIRNARIEGELRVDVKFIPLQDEKGEVYAALGTTQDITRQRKLEADLLTRNQELAESEEAKSGLIERLRYAVDELSNPILEVWDDVLVMPIIGLVDSRRIADMVQRLLAEVTRTQASFVIVDLTGVEIVDTKTADHLIKLMKKVEIVGARCVLTGIRPAVSETLVDIGVDFGRVMTLRNLKHGLREALRHKRSERHARADLLEHEEPESGPRANGRRKNGT